MTALIAARVWRTLACLALAMYLSTGGAARAGGVTVLTLDGRDAANLAGDGNHAPFHNPPCNFAFTFGGVQADNPYAGPGDPPTATETNFNLTGNDFGALGFGTASAGDHFFNTALAVFEIDLTVHATNTLSSLILQLKDADSPGHLIEEHQYSLALGGPGTKTLTTGLIAPIFTNTPRDGIPNFDPGNGLTELQLQYPFSLGGTGAILDVTVHEIRIVEVPEPGSAIVAVAMVAVGAVTRRR